MILLSAKYKLVESDLYKFQTDAYILNDTINSHIKKHISSSQNFTGVWGAQPETAKFLFETLSTMLTWHSPVVTMVNQLIDKSTDYLLKTVLSTDETFMPEFIIESGLMKYHVSKGVFSQRASHSIALAESAVVKAIISIFKDTVKPSFSGYESLNLREFGNSPAVSAYTESSIFGGIQLLLK